MKFGYARVSSKVHQTLDRQLDSLKAEGCDEIFQEKISGRSKDKPQLDLLLSKLRKGDVLIVDSLDRLSRTAKQLISLLADFEEKGIHLKSLKEGIFDTSSPMGRAVFQIVSILKTAEVEVLRERTLDGLKAARARGKNGGRPTGTYNKMKSAAAATLYKKGDSISNILEATGIKSKSTLYQYLRREGVLE
ncbi:recombinase family protein [Carboxylicivirga sp. RSCT41]|uniref:recombinase family protein n=1 Tax=Carboxylicivirga agarovorans TaxID=3417570 RepID=UPI003D32A1CB